MMPTSEGNTSVGGFEGGSRPLPRADAARSRRAHERVEKPTGLDWSKLVPACKRCGTKSGAVNSESGLCPACQPAGAGAPAAAAPVVESTVDEVAHEVPDAADVHAVVDDDPELDDASEPEDEHGGSDLDEAELEADHDDRTRLLEVLVDELHPDPDNPRERLTDIEDLAASIESVGLLQPIVARRVTTDGVRRLVVVAGHRRLAAVQHLGRTRVACIVRRDMPADEVLAAMLVENGQRAGLDPIEEARALNRLAHDHKLGTHKLIAKLVGRSQPHVSGRLALLDLSVEDQDAVRAGELSLGTAVRRGQVAAGKVRSGVSTGSPHLGADHDLARRAKARCQEQKHKRGGRNSVGGVACGECWESVIRADERRHLHDKSNERGRCVLCTTPTSERAL